LCNAQFGVIKINMLFFNCVTPTVLEPGQVEDNFIMLPAKATISYGACFGGYYSTKQTENGEYICK